MIKVIGHILIGVALLGLGLWHLINHIKLFFSLGPASYVAPAWFPVPRRRLRYLELVVLLGFNVYGCGASIVKSMNSQPSGPDDENIRFHFHPKSHEHILFFAMFIVYASSAMYLDIARVRGRHTLCTLLLAVVFELELFIFQFHSTGHSGVWLQLHLLLEPIVTVCLATALLGAILPQSFAVSLVRSAAVAFQGVWFLVIGVKWIPSMASEGCWIDVHKHMYRCDSEASEHHAMAVVKLQFGWCMVLMSVLVVGLYSYMSKSYPAVEAAACYGLVTPEAADESDDIKKVPYNCKAVRSIGDDLHEVTPTQIRV